MEVFPEDDAVGACGVAAWEAKGVIFSVVEAPPFLALGKGHWRVDGLEGVFFDKEFGWGSESSSHIDGSVGVVGRGKSNARPVRSGREVTCRAATETGPGVAKFGRTLHIHRTFSLARSDVEIKAFSWGRFDGWFG